MEKIQQAEEYLKGFRNGKEFQRKIKELKLK